MEVLFLSGIDGFCHRYEVLHRAAQLRLRNVASTVRHFTDPRTLEDVARATALFLYRVPLSPLVGEVLARARRAGRLVLGSIDDLVFAPERDALPPLDHLTSTERALWLEGVERYRATLELCDAFVAPSEPLLEQARAMGWPAFLHRDGASAVELALSARARERRERSLRECAHPFPVTLGYFSGTPTHDADFAEAAPAILELMRQRPETRLLVVGPLDLGEPFRGASTRVERRPRVPWPELPDLIAQVDVNLAPLAWRTRFAAAKGEVKYIEAAAVGVPTVASPTPAFRHAIRDGDNGYLAPDTGAWLAALIKLVDEPGMRVSAGRRAFADVRERFSPALRADELVRILAAASPGRVPAERIASVDGGRTSLDTAARWREGERPARVALEPDARPDVVSWSVTGVSPPLAAGSVLEQKLVSQHDGLFRVDVLTVTYGQSLAHHVAFLLERDDGRVAALRHDEARHAPDRAWYALELPPEGASRGARYRLSVRAAGTGPGNALSFGLANGGDSGDTGPAYLDGRPLDGALAIRTFASWGAGLTGRRRPSARPRSTPCRAAPPIRPPGEEAPF